MPVADQPALARPDHPDCDSLDLALAKIVDHLDQGGNIEQAASIWAPVDLLEREASAITMSRGCSARRPDESGFEADRNAFLWGFVCARLFVEPRVKIAAALRLREVQMRLAKDARDSALVLDSLTSIGPLVAAKHEVHNRLAAAESGEEGWADVVARDVDPASLTYVATVAAMRCSGVAPDDDQRENLVRFGAVFIDGFLLGARFRR